MSAPVFSRIRPIWQWVCCLVVFICAAVLPACAADDTLPVDVLVLEPGVCNPETLQHAEDAQERLLLALIVPKEQVGKPLPADGLVVPALALMPSTTPPRDNAKSDGQDHTFTRSLVVAGILLMPADERFSQQLRLPEGKHLDGFSSAINDLGTPQRILPLLGGMYLLGSDYDKDSAKMALTALINAGALSEGMKKLTGRARPFQRDDGEFAGLGSSNTSFPSGHTTAAFAIATVLAERYPKRKWLYYGLAALVGVERIRLSAHYPSDVLVGAALGISQGKAVVHGGTRLFQFRF